MKAGSATSSVPSVRSYAVSVPEKKPPRCVDRGPLVGGRDGTSRRSQSPQMTARWRRANREGG
jgi:hypothetical protein